MAYDIAIIGTGSVGSFAAYYAAKGGKKVCMVDRFAPPHTHGSYHGDTRIFRIAYGEGSKYIPLLQRAYALWGEFEKASNTELFCRRGVLNAGSEGNEFMQNIAKSASEFGLNVERLTPAQIAARYGVSVPSDFVGILERDTGFTKSQASIELAIKGARANGADAVWGEIERISRDSSGFELRFNGGEKIHAKQLVISAGSYVAEVLGALAFDVRRFPIEIKRKVVHWYAANGAYSVDRNDLAAFILEHEGDHFYGFFDFGEGLKIGRDQSGQYIERREERVDFGAFKEDFSEIQCKLRDFFPQIGEFVKGSVCTYPLSPDNDFILDFLSEDIFVLAGLSHGFKFAPVLGELAINALNSGTVSGEIIRNFGIGRF